jgi:hypothetical protein
MEKHDSRRRSYNTGPEIETLEDHRKVVIGKVINGLFLGKMERWRGILQEASYCPRAR